MGLLDRLRARSLSYFEFPGGGYSVASLGLDGTLEELGLSPAPTPRHADLLIVVGPVTPELEAALGRIQAEIPRPRYVLAVGTEELSIPVDARSSLGASDLEEEIRNLRQRIAGGYRGTPPVEKPEDEEGGEEDGDMDHGHMRGEMHESEDGLALETVEMPLGPVHPATPGGLGLTVTLDGDLVAGAELEGGYLARGIFGRAVRSEPEEALEALRLLDPRTPIFVPLLYARARENLARTEVPEAVRFGRVYLLELERASSHLLWFSGFARVLGAEDAAKLALAARRPLLPALWSARTEPGGLAGLVEADLAQAREGLRVARAPLERRGSVLSYRLEGLAPVSKESGVTGPVARASGVREDARIGAADYEALGFEPVLEDWGDALARYRVRVREIEASLGLAREAFVRAGTETGEAGPIADGEVTGVLEGPRGRAVSRLAVEGGQAVGFALELPSRANAKLLEPLIEGVSLSDAVVALWSLDLSVEEMDG